MYEREQSSLFSRNQFLENEKQSFASHVDFLINKVLRRPNQYPLKVVKYARLARAGLPLDFTVRYYPGEKRETILRRVYELTNNGLEVWVSFAPPDPPGIARSELLSSAQSTDLIKRVASVEDFEKRTFPLFEGRKINQGKYPKGTWVKTFYDSHETESDTISGSLTFSSGSEKALTTLWRKGCRAIVDVSFTPDIREIHRGRCKGTHLTTEWKDNFWKYKDPRDKSKHGKLVTDSLDETILKKVESFLGPHGTCVEGLKRVVFCERRPSIDFEFKIRPGDTFLPFFLIDYEFGGRRELTVFEKRRIGGREWFYRREGD